LRKKRQAQEKELRRFSSPDIPNSRPTSTGSKSSLHTPDITGEESRKRPGSPLVSPPISKKPATSSSGEGSAPDETRRWQDEISMGFDRLVAMASEVDKRRKSAENSPQQVGSPRKGAADLRLNDASFDQNTLAAKFKAGLMQAAATPASTDKRHIDERERSSASGSQEKPHGPSPNFPGGNLPEHHFKKRYFNEEYQRQQQRETEQSRTSNKEQAIRHESQSRPEPRPSNSELGRGPVQQQIGFDQRRHDARESQRFEQHMRPQYDQSRSSSSGRPPHPDQARQEHSSRHLESQRSGSYQNSDHGRHPDQRMYQEARRGHFEQQGRGHMDPRLHDPRSQHGEGRQRPQMYSNQGYPDRQSQRDYNERDDYRSSRHPQEQYRSRGPAPSGVSGQQGYPGHHYPNPQIMQAMYRHQQMMYGNRPPPPQPPNK